MSKITINDVAAAAGVSVTTVSLVLSGKGRISAATMARVNEAIEQLGFVRNRSATMLRGGESGVIGLIVRDLSQPFYAEMTAGLSEALEKQGKLLFLTQSAPRDSICIAALSHWSLREWMAWCWEAVPIRPARL